MSKMLYGFGVPSRKHQTSRFLQRHRGKAGGKWYQTRHKGELEFEVGKGLLDWNSLIAIGD
jgi:hypothetical protein